MVVVFQNVVMANINAAPNSSSTSFVVERVVDKHVDPETGIVEYCVKWQSYPEWENTWELLQNLQVECPDLIREFEDANETTDTESTDTSFMSSFERGRVAEAILQTSLIAGVDGVEERFFEIKWVGHEETEMVTAADAKQKCPAVVFRYYEELLHFV